MARAQENAEALATFLSGHPAVGKIHYPGLPGHPRRELHFSQASGAGSIISLACAISNSPIIRPSTWAAGPSV